MDKKKFTFKQLNLYLLLMYLMSGLMMALALFVYTRFLDNWCIEHKDEIHKYPGKVTACYPKSPSHGQPFNIEIDLSNGRHVLIVDNDKMQGSVLVYAYESGAVNYYTFTERTLSAKVNGAQRRFVVFLIVILTLVPLAIYLWLIRTRRP